MLELGDPLNTDETGTNNEDGGLFLVELGEAVVLLEDMTTAALDEALVDVGPGAVRAGLLVDGGEPEGLSPLVEGTEIATSRDHAVVKADGLDGFGEHGLDVGASLVELLDLAPEELNTKTAFEHILKSEGKSIEMGGLDVGAKNTGGVLEIFFGINDGNLELLVKITGNQETGETYSKLNNNHCFLMRNKQNNYLTKSRQKRNQN